MSTERFDITGKAAGSEDPPDALKELRDQLKKLSQAATEGGAWWALGKGKQELAKAAEIIANVQAKLGQIEIDRQRFVQERDAMASRNRRINKKEKNRHDEEMFKLETERMAAKADALAKMITAMKALHDMGLEVDVTIIQRTLTSS